MFRIKRPNLRFIDEPAGEFDGGGTSDEPEIDYSNFGLDDEVAETPVGDSAAPAEPDKSPDMWAPVLEALPDDATRAMIKPKLAEWDKGTTQRFQKIHEQYAPLKQYSKFQEQQVPPERLEAAYQLFQQIDANPVAFMERMQTALTQAGLIKEAQQVQQAIDSEQSGEEELDPVEVLRREQQEFFQNIERQRQAEEQRQFERQVDQRVEAETAALNRKYGGERGQISPVLMQQVYEKAFVMNQNSSTYIPLERAFQEVQKVLSAAQRNSPSSRAPRVLPPGGGLPTPAADSAVETPAQRKARAVEIVARMQQEAQGS